MNSVIINGFELTEADRAALVDALQLYQAVCHGEFDAIGEALCNEFAARPDVTNDERRRVARVRELFAEASKVLHGTDSPKVRLRADEAVVPMPGVRAYQILGRIVGNDQVVRSAAENLRTQAEMSDPHQ